MKKHLLYGLAPLSLGHAACDDDEVPNNLNPDLPCNISVGTLSGGPYAFTTDGLEDRLTGVSVSGGEGPRRSYVLTDGSGDIVRVYGSVDDLQAENLDALPAGNLQVYYATYQVGLRGLTRGGNIDDLDGCAEVSAPIGITREPCPTDGGTLTADDGAALSFSIDDDDDNIDPDDFSVADASGERSAYLLTDTGAVVLGIYEDLDAVAEVDLETLTDDETVLLWYAAIDGELRGDTVGTTPAQIQGCFDLSNSIALTRECRADGGELTGGPYSFSVDGQPDRIPAGSLSLDGAEGSFTTYVVTDADGVILGLPATLSDLEDVDFDGAGEGTCLIWHLSANTALTGDSIGGDATALGGCYDLSNPVEVRRNCEANGGRLQGGARGTGGFAFAVDSIPDFVSGITLSNEAGDNSTYVVTDADGVIIALPATLDDLEDVDFDDAAADPDTRLIWHLSFNGPIGGAEVGASATAITGCADLSNSLTVTRSAP